MGVNFKLECHGNDGELQETESAPRLEPKPMISDIKSSIDTSTLRGSMSVRTLLCSHGERGSDLLTDCPPHRICADRLEREEGTGNGGVTAGHRKAGVC